MRKIGILKPIIIGMFIILMLPACEKDTVDETEHHTANESDKPLEKESGVVTYKSFEGGAMFIADNYVDVDLHQDYYITDIYMHNTLSEYVQDLACGRIVIPVDLNMGCSGGNVLRVYLAIFVRKYIDGMSCVKDLHIDCSFSPYNFNFPPDWSYCKNIAYYCSMTPFDKVESDLNIGTGGYPLYLRKKITPGTSDAIKKLRIAYSTSDWYAKSIIVNNEYTLEDRNMNYGNTSSMKIYLGWKDVSRVF
jgi:hypothetical protein